MCGVGSVGVLGRLRIGHAYSTRSKPKPGPTDKERGLGLGSLKQIGDPQKERGGRVQLRISNWFRFLIVPNSVASLVVD